MTMLTRLSFIAAILLSTAACSAQSKLTTSQESPGQLAGYRSIAVDVTAAATRVSSNRDYQTVHDNLTAAITSKIPTRTPFTLATDAKTQGTAALVVDVRELRYTSQAGRIMAGAAAGGAILRTGIALTDGATGKLLWEAESYATTRGQSGMAAASTTTQVEALSDQIIQELKARLAPP